MDLYQWHETREKPIVHIENLNLIRACQYNTTIGSFRLLFPGTFDGTETLTQWPADSTCPKMSAFYSPTNTLVVVDGATLFSQVSNFMDSWGRPFLFDNNAFAPDYLQRMATIINGRIDGLGARSSANIGYLGYSIGGAACTLAWNGRQFEDRSRTWWLATYGSPRIGPDRFVSSVDPHAVRVYSIDDVVPNIPPHSNESPVFHLLLARGVGQGADRCNQPSNAIAIDSAGNTMWLYQTPMAIPAFQGAAAAWILGTQAEGSTPHSLLTYSARFASASTIAGLARAPVHAPANPPRIPGPARRQVQQQITQAVQQLSAQALANPAAQIAASTPQLVIKPNVRFTRYSDKGIRYVAYGEDLVCVVANKREQRRMVRAYNAWLKQNPIFQV